MHTAITTFPSISITPSAVPQIEPTGTGQGQSGDLRRVVFERLQSLPTVLDSQTLLIFEDADTR